jgi:hypothetical protein
MPPVPEYADEIALAWCLLLNAAVFASAYRFALRRMEGGQAILDALLLTFTVQYASVGIPGLLGLLGAVWITATAALISAGLWWAAGNKQRSKPPEPSNGRWILLAAAIFAVGFVLVLAYNQRWLPVMSNDALTYHFPAATQWLQHQRIDLFSVWFFNPANSYSPLGGSTFIVWLMAPFGNDVLARFVQVPALIFVGVGVFQLGRELGADDATAALVGAAAIVARLFINQAISGGDDLFVVGFFISALIAMTPKRAAEKFGPLRLGIALGLLLAMKYTAILGLSMLLLAVDGPQKSGWRWGKWLMALAVAGLFAGPWYLRNLWLTGNPIFPLSVSLGGTHFLHGLFTTTVSDELRNGGAWSVLTGHYAMPASLLVLLAVAWIVIGVVRGRSMRSDPLLRACLLGPVVALMLFIWRSPFAEARFVFPAFAMLFGIVAAAIALVRPIWARWILAAVWMGGAVFTAFASHLLASINEFIGEALLIAAVVVIVVWLTRSWPKRARFAFQMIVILCVAGFAYVYWPAYLQNYREGLFSDGSGWDAIYPPEKVLWKFVDEQIPRDATVAYTNLYLIYPMQGFSLSRRLVYAPTRAGVRTMVDLPWLGDHLPGEALVPAAARATVAEEDRSVWLENLRRISAGYLVVGKGGVLGSVPEAAMAVEDPQRFHKLFENERGVVYRID